MGAIRLSDGYLVDPFKPKKSDVKPGVFIHSLACINRYTGHAKYPYSVGQHTRNLVLLVPKHLKRAAMVHDWSEAWFNDLASPVKKEFTDYQEAEHKAMLWIARQMKVSVHELRELDYFDKAIYINERNALFDERHDVGMGDDRVGVSGAEPWMFYETEWRVIKQQLTYWYNELFPERKI